MNPALFPGRARPKCGVKSAAALLLLFPLNAAAFLFGGISDKKAEDMLAGMAANFDKGDCQAVDEISQTLFSEKPSSAIREKAYSYMGRCYETHGLPDKAMTIYKLAYDLSPESDFFALRLASIYLTTGFYANAVPLFEKTLQSRSDNLEANAGLARCYASLGFLSKAKPYYSKAAILSDFGDLDFLKEYTAQMLRKRDWEEAALIAAYAVKLAPGDSDPREALARVAAGRGDYKQAAAQMRNAVKLKPSDADLALELALLELLGGNYEAALGAIPAPYSDTGPAAGTGQRGLALVIRGMALHKKGERARALEYFKEAAGSSQPFIAEFAAALAKSK